MKIKYTLIIVTIMAVSMVILNLTKGNNMSILQDQPVFNLDVDTYGCKHIINVNGVALIKDMDPTGQSESTFPVNHFMRSGVNSIDIYIFPDNPKETIRSNTRAKIALTVANNSSVDKKFPVADISYNGGMTEQDIRVNSQATGTYNSSKDFIIDKDGDIKIHDVEVEDVSAYPGAIKITRKIYISSNIPEWAFFNSEEIPDIDALSDKDYYKEIDRLLVTHLKIQDAIRTRNIDSVLPLFKERNDELDKAFYLEPGTYENKIKTSLLDVANDDGLELLELTGKMVNIKVGDNRKLVSLNRDGFKAAIALNFKEGNGSQRYPLVFRLDQGEWVLTR